MEIHRLIPENVTESEIRNASYVVFVCYEDEVFRYLIQKNPFSHVLPGGGVEPGQTTRETAVIEVSQEVGQVIDANKLVYFGAFEFNVPFFGRQRSHTYVAPPNTLPYEVGESPEAHLGVMNMWLTVDDAEELLNTDQMHPVVYFGLCALEHTLREYAAHNDPSNPLAFFETFAHRTFTT